MFILAMNMWNPKLKIQCHLQSLGKKGNRYKSNSLRLICNKLQNVDERN